MLLDQLTLLITGGTGSLGSAIVRRLMSGRDGLPRKVIVFSRDEFKHYEMERSWKPLGRGHSGKAEHSVPPERLEFRIGDVRNYESLLPALQIADIVIHAAAMKQVPQCERFPSEAVRTNISGTENIVRGIVDHRLPVRQVVGVSTDKACKPVNVMGMTKALQERLFLAANELTQPCNGTSFMAVRYGNVLSSRGSVIPAFIKQLEEGLPLSLTSPEMTRFLLTQGLAVETVFEALNHGERGETIVPRVPSARIIDVAHALAGTAKVRIDTVGIRAGEKLHEVLISEDEARRTILRNRYYVIKSILGPTPREVIHVGAGWEYSSRDGLLSMDELSALLNEETRKPIRPLCR